MFNEFLETTQQLYQDKEAFAIAFVINRQTPSSGKPGDKAVIKQDGSVKGWIGGGCTRGIVIKEAQAAIQEGKARVVRISPDAELMESTGKQNGINEYKMTCHSGGMVELYIEPVLPKPHVLILGKSHVAMALSKLARAVDYSVTVLAKGVDKNGFPDASQLIDSNELKPGLLKANTVIVVCTQGDGDEKALEQAIQADVPYVSFVASRRKANAVFNYLHDTGISFEELQQIKTPAGLDINAKLPEEVAVSILAEIIALIRSEAYIQSLDPQSVPTQTDSTSDIFINPVCNIPVQKSTAKHVINYQGEDYYFCCDGCKVSFEQEPEKYAVVGG